MAEKWLTAVSTPIEPNDRNRCTPVAHPGHNRKFIAPTKMTESDANIRESLLNTLTFLCSISQQREFASKVPYESYAGEFACWWFDTFYPDEPNASVMFRPRELLALKAFSEDFDRNLSCLSSEGLSIDELQATTAWQAIVASAQKASRELKLPADG